MVQADEQFGITAQGLAIAMLVLNMEELSGRVGRGLKCDWMAALCKSKQRTSYTSSQSQTRVCLSCALLRNSSEFKTMVPFSKVIICSHAKGGSQPWDTTHGANITVSGPGAGAPVKTIKWGPCFDLPVRTNWKEHFIAQSDVFPAVLLGMSPVQHKVPDASAPDG